jgi:hypothetical protein
MQLHLQDIIEWLRTKPADETFLYTLPSDCLIAQFMRSKGLLNISVGTITAQYYDPETGASVNIDVPSDINHVAMGDPSSGDVDTYGAALERAYALQAGQGISYAT